MTTAQPYIQSGPTDEDSTAKILKIPTNEDLLSVTCGSTSADHIPDAVSFREKIYLNCEGEEVEATHNDKIEILALSNINQSAHFLNRENGHFNRTNTGNVINDLLSIVSDDLGNIIQYARDDDEMQRAYPDALLCITISSVDVPPIDVVIRQTYDLSYVSVGETTRVNRGAWHAYNMSILNRTIKTLPSFLKEHKTGEQCRAKKSKFYTYDFGRGIEEMCARGRSARGM